MGRVTRVERSRFPNECGKCHKAIPKGASYFWFQSRVGPKLVRCIDAGCTFRHADLSSAKTAPLLDACDDAEADIRDAEDVETIKQHLSDVASTAQDVESEYRDASANWAGGNGHAEWDEKADQLSDFSSNLESWEPSTDAPEPEEGGFGTDEERRQAWLEEVRDEAIDVLLDRSWE